MIVREPSREIPVLAQVDILVAGAGVAGCAAAVAAARAGAKTMLVERDGILGGVATAGLMANTGNRYMDRDGHIVIHGIAKEVIERLVARGAASEKWACREVPGIGIVKGFAEFERNWVERRIFLPPWRREQAKTG